MGRAIAFFELNVRENPASANTYDSLAEGYLERNGEGDVARAVENFKKALEKIDGDPSPDRDFLERLREHAESRLAKLQQRRLPACFVSPGARLRWCLPNPDSPSPFFSRHEVWKSSPPDALKERRLVCFARPDGSKLRDSRFSQLSIQYLQGGG